MRKTKLVLTFLLVIMLSVSAAESPKIALVLSGGGARGFAHIPIIEALEEAGIPIDMVLGTSMGALVGGLYAAGYSPGDMRELIASYNMLEFFSLSLVPPVRVEPQPLKHYRYNLFSLNFDSKGVGRSLGIIQDHKILLMLNNALSRVMGIDDFDHLETPFRAIGADIISGERVILSTGSLTEAIRSSISIPLLFSPYPLQERFLVDGGLVDNLPVSVAKEMGADIVIAVDVNSSDYQVKADELESLSAMLGQLVVVITKQSVLEQLDEVDLLFTPNLEKYQVLSFNQVDDIIEVGKSESERLKEEISLLAKKISETRPLVPQDPQRRGSYFSYDEIYISNVFHSSISQYDGVEFHLAPFYRYVGKPLNQEMKVSLENEFTRLRQLGDYDTLSYSINALHKDESTKRMWGNLEIQSRTYPAKTSTISAALYGATSFHFGPTREVEFDHRPDFALKYTLYSLFSTPLSLNVELVNDDALYISGELNYRGHWWLVGLKGSYTTGGIHPLNLRSLFTGVTLRDRMIGASFIVESRFQKDFVINLSTNVDYLWFGENPDESQKLLPSFRLDTIYTTVPLSLFPKNGVRIELSLLSEYPTYHGYKMEGAFHGALSVTNKDTLALTLKGATSHGLSSRKYSFFNYGGTKGIPTYKSVTLVDDALLAQLKYYHTFNTPTLSTHLYSMVAMGYRGNLMEETLTPTTYVTEEGPLFSSLGEFEMSGAIGVGLSFETIDLLFGVALDNRLRFSLFLEVL